MKSIIKIKKVFANTAKINIVVKLSFRVQFNMKNHQQQKISSPENDRLLSTIPINYQTIMKNWVAKTIVLYLTLVKKVNIQIIYMYNHQLTFGVTVETIMTTAAVRTCNEYNFPAILGIKKIKVNLYVIIIIISLDDWYIVFKRREYCTFIGEGSDRNADFKRKIHR